MKIRIGMSNVRVHDLAPSLNGWNNSNTNEHKIDVYQRHRQW